MVEIEKKRK
ncbi:hypothetical protein SNEBB_002273, partial [Seison nebaliae]